MTRMKWIRYQELALAKHAKGRKENGGGMNHRGRRWAQRGKCAKGIGGIIPASGITRDWITRRI